MRLLAGPLFGILLFVAPAMAQDHDRIELKGVVGTAGFLDSPTDYHHIVGGAARLYVSPAFAVEPEFTYMRASSRRQDYAFQMGVLWQFRRGGGSSAVLGRGGRSSAQPFEVPGCPPREVFIERGHRRRRDRHADWCRTRIPDQSGASGWRGANDSRNRQPWLHTPLSGTARAALPTDSSNRLR